MSQRMLSIHAYDCLETIVYSAKIREYDDTDEAKSEVVCSIAGELPGRGHPFWPHWLADVLNALLEEM
jgi:hypothetical protein